jgi:hypothetical protein
MNELCPRCDKRGGFGYTKKGQMVWYCASHRLGQYGAQARRDNPITNAAAPFRRAKSIGKRRDARFCSDRSRQRAHRSDTAKAEIPPTVTAASPPARRWSSRRRAATAPAICGSRGADARRPSRPSLQGARISPHVQKRGVRQNTRPTLSRDLRIVRPPRRSRIPHA